MRSCGCRDTEDLTMLYARLSAIYPLNVLRIRDKYLPCRIIIHGLSASFYARRVAPFIIHPLPIFFLFPFFFLKTEIPSRFASFITIQSLAIFTRKFSVKASCQGPIVRSKDIEYSGSETYEFHPWYRWFMESLMPRNTPQLIN